MNTSQIEMQFNELLLARDTEYERKRIALFTNPLAIQYLNNRRNDQDPVISFIANVLYVWATENPPEFAEIEHFIHVIEPQLRENDKTAAGGGGTTALIRYLGRYQKDKEGNRQLTDYLLLRVLMQPRSPDYIYGALLRYYKRVQVPHPEVWIRVAMEKEDKDYVENITQESLNLVAKPRLLLALNYEESRAKRLGYPFPNELAALRITLLRDNK